MPIIDVHTHYLPESVVEALRRRNVAPAIETQPDGTERRLMPQGHTLPFTGDAYSDIDARIALMDRLGIARQVLSMGQLFGIQCLPIEESLPLVRMFNDDLGALCDRHPNRFSGIALLPMDDLGATVAEFKRARAELGLMGAIIPASHFETREEAENLVALFQAGQELGGWFFIHPGPRPDEYRRETETPSDASQEPDNRIARQALTVQTKIGAAAITLLLTGFLDPYPDILVHVANLGGTLPAVVERMDQLSRLHTPDDKPPSRRMRRIYIDTASLGQHAIELAVSIFGADRVMFGTDLPIFPIESMQDAVQAARMDDDQRAQIVNGNALALIERFK